LHCHLVAVLLPPLSHQPKLSSASSASPIKLLSCAFAWISSSPSFCSGWLHYATLQFTLVLGGASIPNLPRETSIWRFFFIPGKKKTSVNTWNRAVESSFWLGGGGEESEGRRPEEIFKFRVSEMPFPGLWGRFDRIRMVRKQRFSMSKFTILVVL
jgi:hypothetical protein